MIRTEFTEQEIADYAALGRTKYAGNSVMRIHGTGITGCLSLQKLKSFWPDDMQQRIALQLGVLAVQVRLPVLLERLY